MNEIEDHIDLTDFDREYGLKDLLPIPVVRELLDEIGSDLSAAVILVDGRIHFGKIKESADFQSIIQHHRKNEASSRIDFVENGSRIMLFDLVHELETIGFLVLESVTDQFSSNRLVATGRLASHAFNRIINLNCQNRMTASLHGQVVTDSYEHLRMKAAQLARSEEKYRLLAENLEEEVERKTQKIKKTQLRMLQQEKMAAIGQLAAGMAHEINNPIGFVISNLNTLRATAQEMAELIGQYNQLTDLLRNGSPISIAPHPIKEQVSAIEDLRNTMDIDFVLGDVLSLIDESLDGAKRVKMIIEHLREFTHPSIETPENVDINHCLETTLAVLSSYVSAGIEVKRDFDNIPHVRCHLREINQVFLNIIKNALQAIGDHGTITIETYQIKDSVVVKISDNGSGIDKAIIGRVFDPFFTTRDVGCGTGLGLTQAFNIIKSHGGTIEVCSNFGKGSTVTVMIPFERRDVSGDHQSSSPIVNTNLTGN